MNRVKEAVFVLEIHTGNYFQIFTDFVFAQCVDTGFKLQDKNMSADFSNSQFTLTETQSWFHETVFDVWSQILKCYSLYHV